MKPVWRILFLCLVASSAGHLLQGRASAQERLPADPVVTGPPIALEAAGSDNRGSRVAGGASLYLLKPYFQNNTAFTISSFTLGMNQIASSERSTEFNWNVNPAYAAWLGWTAEGGLGIRSRYFTFEQSSERANASLSADTANNGNIGNGLGSITSITSGLPAFGFPTNPLGGGGFNPGLLNPLLQLGAPGLLASGFINGGPGIGKDVLVFGSGLRIESWDFEATWQYRSGNWNWLTAAGGRYLQLSQNFFASQTNSFTDPQAGLLSELHRLNAGRNFKGGGPTLDFEASYVLGQSGLSLFGNVRGAFLVGQLRDTRNLDIVLVIPNGNGGAGNRVASNSTDTTLPIIEVEAGIDFTQDFGRWQPFLRAAVVSQTYFDAGSASQRDGNLSLFGGQVTLGIRY